MSKIYLALINASSDYWEREGVLRSNRERKGRRMADRLGAALETSGRRLGDGA